MKIVAISATHSRHRNLKLPKGDVLVHAGDVSYRGREDEVRDFVDWFASRPHPHKIFIAGNHDFYFEREAKDKIQQMLPGFTIGHLTGIVVWKYNSIGISSQTTPMY